MGEPRGLAARTALDGLEVSGDGVRIAEHAPVSLVSIAFGAHEASVREAVEAGLGTPLPDLGHASACAFAGGATLLGLQPDQWFVCLAQIDAPAEAVRAAVGADAAVADCSDAWAVLAVTGPRAVVALERTCRLDLHTEAFPPGRVARTAMDHLATIVWREAVERFTLLSPRSSAGSFGHAMATSVRNVS